MQEYGRELEREVSACRVPRDNDVGWRHAFVQQVLDSGNRLAQLGREGIFRYEGYGRTINERFVIKYHASQENAQ
jgi:hypothetical protein